MLITHSLATVRHVLSSHEQQRATLDLIGGQLNMTTLRLRCARPTIFTSCIGQYSYQGFILPPEKDFLSPETINEKVVFGVLEMVLMNDVSHYVAYSEFLAKLSALGPTCDRARTLFLGI